MLYSKPRKGKCIRSYGWRGWFIAKLKNGKQVFFVGEHFFKEDPKRLGHTIETREHNSLESCKSEIDSR